MQTICYDFREQNSTRQNLYGVHQTLVLGSSPRKSERPVFHGGWGAFCFKSGGPITLVFQFWNKDPHIERVAIFCHRRFVRVGTKFVLKFEKNSIQSKKLEVARFLFSRRFCQKKMAKKIIPFKFCSSKGNRNKVFCGFDMAENGGRQERFVFLSPCFPSGTPWQNFKSVSAELGQQKHIRSFWINYYAS